MRGVVILSLAAAFAAGCLDETVTEPVTDLFPTEMVVEWRQVANATNARSEHAVGQIGPDLYIIGGYTADADGVPLAERYNVETGAWTTLPDMPAGTHHTTATGVAGALYVVGGFDMAGPGLTMTDRAFKFDPATNAWSEIAPLLAPRAAHAAAEVDGKLYVVGGYTVALAGHTPQVEVYDPATDTWTPGAPMPTGRDHLGAAAVDGKIYAVGGDFATHSNTADVLEAYDTETGLWESLGALPTPRGSMSAVAFEGKVWVMGGQDGTRTYDDVDVYDPATGEWSKMAPMMTTRHGFGSGAWGDKVYVVEGGPEPGASQTGSIEAFGPHPALAE